MTVRRARIVGCGSYLPERQVTNDELALSIDTSDEWIVQRTGIKSRHIAAEDEMTSDMALAAARPALAQAGVDPGGTGFDRLGDHNAGPHISRNGRPGSGRIGHGQRHGV